MSSITKSWTEEDFRKELKKLDRMVEEKEDIKLAGAELGIEFTRSYRTLGMYYPKEKKFKFSLLFFNSDIPEACAIGVIRHEYAHYYADMVFGQYGHGPYFKAACSIVGTNSDTYYSRWLEEFAREREARDAMRYKSDVFPGQLVIHPQFNEGRVLKVENEKTTAILTIDFGEYGIRIIDEVWLKRNGVI